MPLSRTTKGKSMSAFLCVYKSGFCFCTDRLVSSVQRSCIRDDTSFKVMGGIIKQGSGDPWSLDVNDLAVLQFSTHPQTQLALFKGGNCIFVQLHKPSTCSQLPKPVRFNYADLFSCVPVPDGRGGGFLGLDGWMLWAGISALLVALLLMALLCCCCCKRGPTLPPADGKTEKSTSSAAGGGGGSSTNQSSRTGGPSAAASNSTKAGKKGAGR